MAKNICDVCNKKINGFTIIGYDIEDSTLCMHCYEELGVFKHMKKYSNPESLYEDRERVLNKVKELNYPENVISSFNHYFDRINQQFKHQQKEMDFKNEIKNHITTTTHHLEGYKISDYLGMVTGQVVLGTGIFSEFNASLADTFGIESSTYTNKLDEAGNLAKERAIIRSIELGGNAIIDLNMEYVTLHRDLVVMMVTGTSVKVEK